jgi:uncharacterized caspase-like protein
MGDRPMRLWIVALSLLAVLTTASAVQAAERRVALVVGNAAYKHLAPLSNPPVDVRAMAGFLKILGFEVIEGTNLSRDAMTEKLVEFGKIVKDADLAVFYYSGRDVAVNGAGYLLPIDADIKSEMDVKLGAAINIALTLEQTMSPAKIKLIFLDTDRINPFTRGNLSPADGIADTSGSFEPDTLIASADTAGHVVQDDEKGAHSPFTRALIANIAAPGVEIEQAMTRVRAQVVQETNGAQLPSERSYLLGAVYLAPAIAGSFGK